MVPWIHPTQHPKRHLDRFSRFAGLTIVSDRQDRPTDHPVVDFVDVDCEVVVGYPYIADCMAR